MEQKVGYMLPVSQFSVVVKSIGLGTGRPWFKSPVSHETLWVILWQSLSLSLTSKGCCEDMRRGGIMYTALSFLEGQWDKNVLN